MDGLACDSEEGVVLLEDVEEEAGAGAGDCAEGPGNAFAILQKGHASGG